MTQQALADCAGCSLVTVRKFEADERRPSRQLAELLAGCLAVPADEREAFVAFARRPDGAPEEAPPLSPLPGAPSGDESLPMHARPAAAIRPPVSLPAPLNSLIGREQETAALVALLLRPGVRLVTLTGPGGTGKTRLAIEMAGVLAGAHPEAFPDGFYFVDLTRISDPALLAPALMKALDLRSESRAEPWETLRTYLRPRRALLVFDNFEQIVGAAAELEQLLLHAAGVKALVTSRAVLQLYGEYEYPVSPLALPAYLTEPPIHELKEFPAIELFVERSRAVRPDFQLTEKNAAAIARICYQLDGLPLAIELAAARSKFLGPPDLLAQLDNSLDLTARQRRDSERQQTLRGAIAWSYNLLSDEEQSLFRALGVFAGDFGPGEVAAVLPHLAGDSGDKPTIPHDELLEQLAALVQRSVLRQAADDDGPRFRLLFVLREFALEQLEECGEAEAARLAHANYFLALAKERGEQMAWNDATAMTALGVALDDLRGAMGWAFGRAESADLGLAIAVALTDYWIQRGMLVEGQSWIRQGLAHETLDDSMLRARALIASGRMAYYQGKFDEAVAAGHEALALLDGRAGEDAERARIVAHRVIGNSSSHLNDFDGALRHQNHIIEIYRQRDDHIGVAQSLQGMGLTLLEMGQFDTAAGHLNESVDLVRVYGGETDDLLLSLNGLGIVELVRGRYEPARVALEEALSVTDALNTPVWRAMILANLGHLALPQGRYDDARQLFSEGKRLAKETNGRQFVFQAELGEATLALLEDDPVGAWPPLRECLDYYHAQGSNPARFLRLCDVAALFCARVGRPALAAELLGRAEAMRERAATQPRFANVQPVYERALALARPQLGDEQFDETLRHGREISEDDLLGRVEALGREIA